MNQTLMKFLPSFVRVRLEGRVNLQNILANTGWLFIDKILRMGVGLFVGVWIARYLGPEQFGLFNYAVAFVMLFSAIATLGLDGIVVRDIVREPSKKNEILGTTFVLRLIGGSIAFLLSVVVISLIRSQDAFIKWLIGIIAAGMIFQAFDTIDFWFQSQVKSKYTVYAKNTAFLLIAFVKVVLISVKASLLAFAWAGLAEVIIGSVALVVIYRINKQYIKAWRSSIFLARRLLKDSWPLILSSIMIMIYMRIDQIMLGNMVGDKEVGLYSAAVRLAEVWYFIPVSIVSSIFPNIVEAKQISESFFYEKLQKLYNVMVFLAYIVAIPTTFLSNLAIKLLYGEAYGKAGALLSVLVWASLFVNLGVARSSFLTTMNWTKAHFLTVFLGCLINVILNYFLIPVYEGMGAAISTCIAYWFAAHGACFFYKPLHKTGFMLTKAIIYPRIWKSD
ncbi:MAG: flippase [Candidatus Jettenia sp. CY-1]|nr:flippase [Candidatus Jettenia sp.]WKZ20295.1 MAG: flippase [Candidatus Jettenia sp. CY-1]